MSGSNGRGAGCDRLEFRRHGRDYRSGGHGLLIPPSKSKAIAEAILTLLRDPERRMAMGRGAREQVLTAYSADVIGPLQEASYSRAIERASAGRTVGDIT